MSALRSVGKLHGRLVHLRRVEVLASHFAELLPAGHRVLDVGCGDGLIAAEILKRRPDLTIAGVDVLLRADSHIPVTPFDGSRLPFADRSWDTLMLCDVLHHTPRPAAMLREAARVARHHLAIKDHIVRGALARPTLRLMDFVGNAPHGVTLPYNYLTQPEWDDVLGQCELRPLHVRHRLGLYPAWADVVFGRGLHFVGLFEIASPSAAP